MRVKTFNRGALAIVFVASSTIWGIAMPAPARAVLTTKNLKTNFTLINLGTLTATVSIGYHGESSDTGAGGGVQLGDPAYRVLSLAANGGSVVVRQYDDATLPPGRGSIVVGSDQPLASVVQQQVRDPGVNLTSGAFSGVTKLDTTWYLPLIARRNTGASGTSSSQIVIQSASTFPANVTVTFSNGTVKNLTVAANGSYYYDIDAENNLPVGFAGSAVVSSSSGRPINVISNFFTGADTLQSYNAIPYSGLTSSWAIAQFDSRLPNGLNTPVTIQNLSGASWAVNAVTLSCTGDPNYNGGASLAFSKQNNSAVANTASFVFNPVTDASFPTNWHGTCTVSAPGTAAVFVQMRYVQISGQPPITGNPNNAAAYEATRANSTDKKAYAPLIAVQLGNGFATTVGVINLSSNTANMTFRYKGSSGNSDVTVTVNNVQPGKGVFHNHRLPSSASNPHGLPAGWVGSLTVESTEPTGGIAQFTYTNNPAGDSFMAHTMFTRP